MTVGRAVLAHDDAGPRDAPALLLVHGFPHGRWLWDAQVAALGDRARCIAPDLPGFGRSPALAAPSMDAYADALVALLDELAVERAVVCGLSMGGYVAFALWRRHPGRVRALALADTRAGADAPEAAQRRRELMALARGEGSAAVAESQLAGSLGKTTRATRPELVAAFRARLAEAPVEGIVGALEAMIDRPDSTPTLATIDVPTLVVVGAEDALTPPKEARALHAAIAGSRLVEIPGAGHVSCVEQPAAFTAALGGLLDAVGDA